MRLISWNLNGRTRAAVAQIETLLEHQPDIVALQEVTRTSLPILCKALADGGLTEIAESFSLAPCDFQPRGPRRYGQLTATRYRLHPEVPGRFAVPWPERVLSVHVEIGERVIAVHNTHIPPGATNGWTKIGMLDGIHAGLAPPSPESRILCGDFNTPQLELATGEVVTWGQRRMSDGRWKIARTRQGRPGSDWDAGERRILTGLRDFGMIDVYRSLHGYRVSDSSWYSRRFGKEVGRRFDHVFASEQLVPTSCRYLHELRRSGLSDHSPIEATFNLSA